MGHFGIIGYNLYKSNNLGVPNGAPKLCIAVISSTHFSNAALRECVQTLEHRMASDNPWLLPQGIEEVLPDEARNVEHLRRHLLDTFQSWGYQQVITPFIEFVSSIPGDFGQDLDNQTLKLTDPISGQTLGVRADMTPQVARIDAHRLRQNVPTRLCYIDTILQAKSDEFASSRSPIQVGCELYGDDSVNADVEVIRLMMETLNVANIQNLTLDVGHVGVLQGLLAYCELNSADEKTLLDILDRKSAPELNEWMSGQKLSSDKIDMLRALPLLNGDVAVLEKAKAILNPAGDAVLNALDNLIAITQQVSAHLPELNIHVDLSEAHGYDYKTGVVFAAYVPASGQALARGGRYDGIGEAFGRARPATGFSVHLKTLAHVGNIECALNQRILAPNAVDAELNTLIASLREAGESVVYALGEGAASDASALNCDRVITQVDGQWAVTSL